MTSKESEPRELHHHQQNQQSEDENSIQKIQSQEEKPHLRPPPLPATMSSSPPPKTPSPPLDSDSPSHSFDHSSHGYVFAPPEVKQATYQSPPSDNVHTSHSYVFSSPPKPSSPPPPPPRAAPVQVESKNPDEETVKPPERRPKISISDRNRENLKRKFLLGFRILGFLFCLISFSIMAADKNQGWALDSFYRYKEFRYCMSVNVIGFVYLGLQSYDLAYCLATGKIVAQNQLRFFLDFFLDQILTYLLLSASSSAAFRVEDWESNWGKDKFPAMARSSVVLSFLAFVAFALSSIVSGHTLFTSRFI